MEINTQQMEALLHLQEQQAQLPRKNNGQSHGFDEILSRQITTGVDNGQTAAEASKSGVTQSLYAQMNPVGGVQGQNMDNPAMDMAYDNVSDALNLWDSYARALGSPKSNSSLRDAYALLEDIDAQVARCNESGMRGQNPGLDAILNEIEIMATTERIKFNRGDYLA